MFVLEMEISKAPIRADRALPATLAWQCELKVFNAIFYVTSMAESGVVCLRALR
jgi:hypothetical protein